MTVKDFQDLLNTDFPDEVYEYMSGLRATNVQESVLEDIPVSLTPDEVYTQLYSIDHDTTGKKPWGYRNAANNLIRMLIATDSIDLDPKTIDEYKVSQNAYLIARTGKQRPYHLHHGYKGVFDYTGRGMDYARLLNLQNPYSGTGRLATSCGPGKTVAEIEALEYFQFLPNTSAFLRSLPGAIINRVYMCKEHSDLLFVKYKSKEINMWETDTFLDYVEERRGVDVRHTVKQKLAAEAVQDDFEPWEDKESGK